MKVFSGKAPEMEEAEFHEMMRKATMDILHAPVDKILRVEKITMDAPRRPGFLLRLPARAGANPLLMRRPARSIRNVFAFLHKRDTYRKEKNKNLTVWHEGNHEF
jgi:hypothetical protein